MIQTIERLLLDIACALSTGAMVIAFTVLGGYLGDIKWLTSWGGNQVMAIPTAISIVFLAMGICLVTKVAKGTRCAR